MLHTSISRKNAKHSGVKATHVGMVKTLQGPTVKKWVLFGVIKHCLEFGVLALGTAGLESRGPAAGSPSNALSPPLSLEGESDVAGGSPGGWRPPLSWDS